MKRLYQSMINVGRENFMLNELSQQLEAELDPPVSAQLAGNTLERAMDCSLVALFGVWGDV